MSVPDVKSYAPAPEEFERLRVRVLEASPSASPANDAYQNVLLRKQAVIDLAAQALRPPEPKKPAGYRVKRSRPAPEPKSPSGYRTKKERPPAKEKDEKEKT
jgi:hypothetical protein